MRRFAALAALLLAAQLPSLATAQPAPGGPPSVGVAKVGKRPITETSQFVGRIQATNRVDLVARITAYLTERMFEEGAEVHKGEVLYRLDRPPFEAQVAAAAATVAQAQAVLRGDELTTQRAQALINTPAGQKSNVDNAVAAQRSQEAQVAGAQAQLRTAQINLDYTEIKAPINGKIGRTNVTIGNVVGPGSGTLATIVSQDPMYVIFPISVRAALDLRDRYADKGGFNAVVVKLQLPNGKDYDQSGKLDYVDPTVATTTDTLTLRAKIPNPLRPGAEPGDPNGRDLVDGEFVTVMLEGVQPIQALTMPRAAVLSDQQGSYVWVVGDGNKVERRQVTLGQSTAETAVIASGLKEGETVVVDGVQRVRPGLVVAPAPAGQQPSVPPKAQG